MSGRLLSVVAVVLVCMLAVIGGVKADHRQETLGDLTLVGKITVDDARPNTPQRPTPIPLPTSGTVALSSQTSTIVMVEPGQSFMLIKQEVDGQRVLCIEQRQWSSGSLTFTQTLGSTGNYVNAQPTSPVKDAIPVRLCGTIQQWLSWAK